MKQIIAFKLDRYLLFYFPMPKNDSILEVVQNKTNSSNSNIKKVKIRLLYERSHRMTGKSLFREIVIEIISLT